MTTEEKVSEKSDYESETEDDVVDKREKLSSKYSQYKKIPQCPSLLELCFHEFVRRIDRIASFAEYPPEFLVASLFFLTTEGLISPLQSLLFLSHSSSRYPIGLLSEKRLRIFREMKVDLVDEAIEKLGLQDRYLPSVMCMS
jgi:hypothetical protein